MRAPSRQGNTCSGLRGMVIADRRKHQPPPCARRDRLTGQTGPGLRAEGGLAGHSSRSR